MNIGLGSWFFTHILSNTWRVIITWSTEETAIFHSMIFIHNFLQSFQVTVQLTSSESVSPSRRRDQILLCCQTITRLVVTQPPVCLLPVVLSIQNVKLSVTCGKPDFKMDQCNLTLWSLKQLTVTALSLGLATGMNSGYNSYGSAN
jgi:hypothetical protein